jgi:hypothetical protein
MPRLPRHRKAVNKDKRAKEARDELPREPRLALGQGRVEWEREAVLGCAERVEVEALDDAAGERGRAVGDGVVRQGTYPTATSYRIMRVPFSA